MLVDRGFRVIRFDNRDIGLSDKLDGVRAPGFFRLLLKSYFGIPVSAAPYNLDDMAADTVGLVGCPGYSRGTFGGYVHGRHDQPDSRRPLS